MSNTNIIEGFNEETNDNLSITLTKCESPLQGIIIRLDGYIDIYTSVFFQTQTDKIIQAGYINLIFDCSKLSYVSSTGIGIFSSLLKNMKLQGGDVVLVNLDSKVMEVFQLLGFAAVFKFCSTVEEAIAFFHQEDNEPPSVFPLIFPCPVCSKKLKTVGAGRFRCSECKSILAVDGQGKVIIG